MVEFIKKYKHGLLISGYFLVYVTLFHYLETRPVHVYHVVHTVFDDMIPFCEYFIVPYLLWFPYMFLAIVYFIFFNKNKREYYQLSFNLMMGMTVFLVISYIYPNIQHLRPLEFESHNIFTYAVGILYKTDTPTNILPSIHVFNSLAIHLAVSQCESLKDRRGVRISSGILTALIILSTMFLKQHSVIDVCMGITLALFGHLLFYPARSAEDTRERSLADYHKQKKQNNYNKYRNH
ncbi:MAG: phosphatase PAP2 family protein [Blautia sp.]|nr:phosphatase PAP2 family protein [Blautia sp.]